MKLLLDENLSRRIVPFLQTNYPESSQVALLGLEASDDKSLWEYAKQHDYVLVTQDSDFHEMSVLYGFPPKVVWLKCGNQPRKVIATRLLDHSEAVKQFYADDRKGCLELY